MMIKRVLDIVLSTLLLVVLSPLLILVGLSILLLMGRPILYVQQRPGLFGEPFDILKFRTMLPVGDDEAADASDAERLTRLGRYLRAWSLDELPELVNVLRGEMSLVGPRPLLVEYLPLYSPEQRRRHEMRPGLTGWAQVNGRNTTTWGERFRLDVWYVDNWSLVLDIRILFLTIVKVIAREGISQSGAATMTRFTGNEDV